MKLSVSRKGAEKTQKEYPTIERIWPLLLVFNTEAFNRKSLSIAQSPSLRTFFLISSHCVLEK